MIDDLVSFASEIIEKADNVKFFTKRCQVAASILSENINQLTKINQTKQIDEENLQIIKDNVSNLSEKIDEIKDEFIMRKFITEKNLIQQTIDDINNYMQNIYLTLSKLGVQNPSKMPTSNLYDDYIKIDEFLERSQCLIRERRKEINDYFKQYHEDFMLSNDNSLDDENLNELNNYPKYKLNKDDFIQESKCSYSNKSFDYYNGRRIKDNKKVTILKLKDKTIFKRLISVLVKINHPNVESFIGAYIENTNITIITNRSGVSLDNYLSLHTADDPYLLKPGDRTILTLKIARAMLHLHVRNIIHRNLVNSNIFIQHNSDDNGGEIHPIVVGFRTSRLLPPNPTISLSNAHMKKTDYCQSPFFAPEFGDGHTYDEKVDVFAFSGILYELLTGEPPFKSLSNKEIKQKLIDGKRPTLQSDEELAEYEKLKEKKEKSELNEPKEIARFIELESKRNLCDLIQMCWEQDPKKRFTFDKIIETMLDKKIVFPQDLTSIQKIEEFYSRNKVKSNYARRCIRALAGIKREIGGAFQYRFELIRARSILQTYQNVIRYSEYSNKEELNEEEKNKLDSLYNELNKFKKIVSNLSYENWDDKSSTIKLVDVTENITKVMQQIYKLMIDLGFDTDEIEEYQENDNDLVFDYRELFSYFIERFGKNNMKLFEIINLNKSKNLNGDVSQKALKERLRDLFSPFKRFEINVDKIRINSCIYDKSNLSKVFIGKYLETNKDVAVKIISERHLKAGEKNLILLRREVGYLTRLKHKYIAEFIGFVLPKQSNDVWLISEYIPDGSLKDKIDLQTVLTDTDITKIAFKIAEVMNYLHSKRVIHLDIKSSNIMMKGKTPKLIDFGFACSDNDTQKFKDENIGTVYYRAPEIYLGKHYDYKADVFSYSMLLYELYSFGFPYCELDSDIEVRNKILEGVNLEYGGDANKALIDLIKSGYNSDPKERPTFEQIINRMIRGKIMFPKANREDILLFYAKKEKVKRPKSTPLGSLGHGLIP